MQHRRFLELAGRVGTGLGIAGPLLGPEALGAFPPDKAKAEARSDKDGQRAPTLATSLDGGWLIATDPGDAGRDQKWFLTPRPDAKNTPVPSIIQEAYPAITELCGIGGSLTLRLILMKPAVIFCVLTP